MSANSYAWSFLAASVIVEVAGNVALRYSHGFSRPLPTVITCLCYATAILLMSLVVKHLEVGLTYAIWAGLGTALTSAIGMAIFNESKHPLRFAGLTLIILGVIALNLTTT